MDDEAKLKYEKAMLDAGYKKEIKNGTPVYKKEDRQYSYPFSEPSVFVSIIATICAFVTFWGFLALTIGAFSEIIKNVSGK